MKLSNLAYAAVGYTLGARAGRERYKSIVRVARRVAGSQTVQSTAGLVHAQFDQLSFQAKQSMAARLTGTPRATTAPTVNSTKHPTGGLHDVSGLDEANGHRR